MSQASIADPSGKPSDLASQQSWRKRSFTLNVLRLLYHWSDTILPASAPYYGCLSLPGKEEQTEYFDGNAAMIPWSNHEVNCWKRSREALQQGADLCRKQDIHLLLCYIPIKFRVYRPFVTFSPDSPCRDWDVWPLPQMFADFCRSADIPYLDLTDFLQEELRNGHRPYAPTDIHWGAEGDALVAHRLAQEFRQRDWLPAARADR